MTVHTAAGTIIKISSAKPETFDAAGYAAIAANMKRIGEVTDLGEFGRKYNVTKHNPVDTRGTVKKKSTFDEGAMQLKLGVDTKDEGQVLAKAALNDDDDYSFEVSLPSGDKYYFQATVTSFPTAIGSAEQIVAGTIDLEIQTDSKTGIGIVEVLAA